MCVRIVHDSVALRSGRAGAQSGDGQHKPNSNCAADPYDDVDDMVFEVLQSPRPQDTCSFETLVTLDANLDCQGRECGVSTVRVVEVIPGELTIEKSLDLSPNNLDES